MGADGGYHGFSAEGGTCARSAALGRCSQRHAGPWTGQSGALAGDAVNPATGRAVPGTDDRTRCRGWNGPGGDPEVDILLRGACRGLGGRRKIARRTLRDLLDELEEIFPQTTENS